MTSIDDERKAAEEVKAVLSSLVPSAPHTQGQIDTLRKAATIATKTQNSLSSQKALNDTRGEAATALNGVCGSLATGRPLTHEMISRARNAVETWLAGLTKEAGLTHPTSSGMRTNGSHLKPTSPSSEPVPTGVSQVRAVDRGSSSAAR